MRNKQGSSRGSGLADVVGDLRSYLEHEKEAGRLTIPVAAQSSSSSPVAAPCVGAASDKSKKSMVQFADLGAIAATVKKCTKCKLHATRTNTVPGQGHPHPEILFIGEGPGEDEDLSGLAFVGMAGKLLTKMIAAMGFLRDEVFIANVVKCRPPGNRNPEPEEVAACMPYLEEQIRHLSPKVIITLGAVASKAVLKTETGITALRGKWQKYGEIDLLPTYHPSYLLRQPSAKAVVWEDLKAALARIGRQPPPVPRAIPA